MPQFSIPPLIFLYAIFTARVCLSFSASKCALDPVLEAIFRGTVLIKEEASMVQKGRIPDQIPKGHVGGFR